MKAMFTTALMFGVCLVSAAADDKKAPDAKKAADAVGTWKLEYEIGGNKRTASMVVKKDGDKLAGTMTWSDQKDEKLKDVKLKDSTLTFSAVRKFMGSDIPIDYKLTIDADKIKGKGSSDFGGQKQEFDISGKREKKDEKDAKDKKDKKDK